MNMASFFLLEKAVQWPERIAIRCQGRSVAYAELVAKAMGLGNLLRGQGAFLGGLVPRWFDTDALLLQKLESKPDWDRVLLFSAKAQAILDLVRRDFEASTPG